jgi:hypothetical protein
MPSNQRKKIKKKKKENIKAKKHRQNQKQQPAAGIVGTVKNTWRSVFGSGNNNNVSATLATQESDSQTSSTTFNVPGEEKGACSRLTEHYETVRV